MSGVWRLVGSTPPAAPVKRTQYGALGGLLLWADMRSARQLRYLRPPGGRKAQEGPTIFALAFHPFSFTEVIVQQTEVVFASAAGCIGYRSSEELTLKLIGRNPIGRIVGWYLPGRIHLLRGFRAL